MSSGQWRVLGLLVILLALEIARNGPVKDFFIGIQGIFGLGSLNKAGKKQTGGSQ